MDILAARKKAADRKAKKKRGPEQERDLAASAEARTAAAGPGPQTVTIEADIPSQQPPAAVTETPAQPSAEDAGEITAQELEMLAFRIGAEEYVVRIEQVREVLKIRDVTPIPHSEGHIMGVTSLRGRMLPIVDLGRLLGLTAGTRDEKSRIVVVSSDEEDTGLLVDRVTGVVRIAQDSVRPAPETLAHGAEAEFIKGIARKDEKLYILLDLEKAVGK